MFNYKSCQKCGHVGSQPPRYTRDPVNGHEKLKRVCPNCGYVTCEKCADAKAPAPSEGGTRGTDV